MSIVRHDGQWPITLTSLQCLVCWAAAVYRVLCYNLLSELSAWCVNDVRLWSQFARTGDCPYNECHLSSLPGMMNECGDMSEMINGRWRCKSTQALLFFHRRRHSRWFKSVRRFINTILQCSGLAVESRGILCCLRNRLMPRGFS